MMMFWGGVAVLISIALAVVILPLLRKSASRGVQRTRTNASIYRQQLRELDADVKSRVLGADQQAQARRDLEARLLEDTKDEAATAPSMQPARRTAFALAALVPVGALGVYLLVGAPGALDPRAFADNAAEHSIDRGELDAMIDKLATRLKAEPENGEAWLTLARSYRYLKRYEDSARAYGNAVARMPPDASLLADYADMLAAAQGGLAGEPEKLIAQALTIEPQNLKALALAGSAAFDRKDYAAAAGYWERMTPLVPAESEDGRAIRANVEEARALAGLAPQSKVAAAAPAAPATPVASAAPGVSGIVQLAPELAGKAAPNDTVLIYARAAEGSRMPLAIMRKQVRELPVKFTLDDTSAMQPGMTLSKAPQVVIAARVSKTPSATAQRGDLEGASAPVPNNATGITLVINSEVQ